MEFDLNEVFAILDENHEGQIQLRRFIDVASNYYSDAEVNIRFGSVFCFHTRKTFSFFNEKHKN